MNLSKLLLPVFLSGLFFSTMAQVHLTEGFESGSKPEGWTEEMASGNEPWRYRNGGHSPNDNNWQVPAEQEDITRNPPAAYDGTFNAIFFKQGDNNERTKLITPQLDLLGATALELSFYLCQIPWTFEGVTGWDVLRVYYKASQEDPWVLLHEYLDPFYDWELKTLTLPNPSQTYYVAFEGQTRWGYGTCIDNVTIQETASQSRYVGEIDFEQPFHSLVPSGALEVPILRLGMKVFGNTDSAVLNQVHFTSMNNADTDIQPGGVKLYSTTTQTFSSDNLLGTPTNFSGGEASFTGLDHTLPDGLSYLWLTYDVELGASHGNVLDAIVAANGIAVGDSLYPVTDQSPMGERIIYETQYVEKFEGTHNWTLTGEFEVGTPEGSGGSPGNPNPQGAFSGTKSLGTDLTGLGANPFNYEPGLTVATSFLASSPSIDVEYFSNLNLFFQRYLNVEVWDQASIELSADGGNSWSMLWANENTFVSDFQWEMVQLPIPAQYARTDQLQIRYKLGPTDGINNYSGWNVDDVFVTGEFITKDVGVSEWIYPLSGSGHTDSDSVTVRITNYGGADIVDPVPVAYSFDGGQTWTVDYMAQTIPVGESVVFTFPSLTDLSQPGLRSSVLAKTNLPGDQYKLNDQFATQLYIIPTYVPPYLEEFEQGDGYWRTDGNPFWEYGKPSGTLINSASSGTESWVTGLSQTYGALIADEGQIIFDDDFETEQGWTYTGEFERAVPDLGNLPYFAYSGYSCIGTDLIGQGTNPYLYENGINQATAYTATSPTIDVSEYSDLALEFEGWIDIQAGDSIKLEVSTDNGSTWILLWKNTQGAISDVDYEYVVLDIDDSLSYTSEMRFRFSLFHSSAGGTVSAGWNIDDILLTGHRVNHDPGYLISPSFDLTGLENPVFEARLWMESEAEIDGANLQYSLNDGESWSAIVNSSGYDSYWNWYTDQAVEALGTNGWSGSTGGWIMVRHLLPAAVVNQNQVMFRFEFEANKINNGFEGTALDDIRLYDAPPDIDVLDILAPLSACELSPDQNFTLRMRNASSRDLELGDSLTIGYHIDRAGEIQVQEEIFYLTQNWGAGVTRDFNMSSLFDFSQSGDYNVHVNFVTEDPHFYNPISGDTVIRVVQVNKPHVDLGEDISTTRPDTVILRAFSGVGGQTYLWQDASTDSLYNVSVEGTYWVSVSNGLGCEASDTIEVLQLVKDVGIGSYNGPLSDCELEDQLQIEISLENFGTDTVEIGESITVHGLLNGSDHFSDEVIFSSRFRPGETQLFTYSRQFDFSLPGSYPLKLYTEMTGDTRPGNDTLNYTLETYGYPDAYLGPDTIVEAAEYLLQPGTGYADYLWQDGSTGESFIINQPGLGLYHVTITDIHQCTGSDSVLVTLETMDMELDQLLAPSTSCELSESITVSARIRNRGNVPIPAGETIQMGYQIDGGPVENDSITLSSQLLPDHTLDFVFSKSETVVPGNWYEFTVFLDYGPDTKTSNDTVLQSVGVFSAPTVDLGDEFQVVAALEHTLDPGAGFLSYEWQDGSTDQTFTINEPGIGLYGVTVTDANGCSVYDEVQVMLTIPDIGLMEVASPVDNCLLKADEHVRVAIKNYGSWNIEPPTTMRVGYSVNGRDAVVEEIQLDATFESGSVINHTFIQAEDFSAPGTYEIMAYADYEGDLVPTNDIVLVNIDHLGSPVVDLGNGEDTLFISEPITLSVDPLYASYLWHDGTDNPDFPILNPSAGNYYVRVAADNGCETHDTVFVVYDIPDIEVSRIVTPSTGCAIQGESDVSVELTNNGYYRISAEENVTLTYSVNGGSSVLEQLDLESDLMPGESRVITFNQRYDFSVAGDYQLQSSIIYLPDQYGSNNVITGSVSLWALPEIDLGAGKDTIVPGLPTTLDAGSGFTSYLWQDNSTASTLDVGQAGLYWVRVTDENACVNYDTVIVEVGTSARSQIDFPDGIRIFPNPVQDMLKVVIEHHVEKEVILELYSINQTLVYRKDMKRSHVSEAKIDVQDLTPGTYYLRITADKMPYSFLVIVE